MAVPVPTAGGEMERLLIAAGLEPDEAAKIVARDPALAETMGQILAALVSGMVVSLGARAKIKNEFRLVTTQFKIHENNPLKASSNVRLALWGMFGQQVPGNLSPPDAVREGFGDIDNHQIAMLAGMKEAFGAVIQRFDPARLQEGFDRKAKGGGILPVINKARYWDDFSALYENLTEDEDKTFQRLFGEAFATAYDKQMQRLVASRRR
jgi:type VI secretion system FHA domain protein